MKLTLQKRLAADATGVSSKRIVFNPSELETIKEAITKQDIRNLISEGIIKVLPAGGVSRGRANHSRKQKKKGLRRGAGSRKGKSGARSPTKRNWINRVRSQRKFLKRLLEKSIITHDVYKNLYKKTGGGFFRSTKHIQIYMTERGLAAKDKIKAAEKKTEPAKKSGTEAS